jgi:hypothetical protein
LLHAERSGRINHRYEADNTTVPTNPTPRECRERHALTVEFVDIAADILESNYVVAK